MSHVDEKTEPRSSNLAMTVPKTRIRVINDAPVRGDGAFVLVWMIASRRPNWSFTIDRAIEHARLHGKPIVVLEPLRVHYPWASDRLHTFALQGMADNAEAFASAGVTYYPYVEREPGEGKGLLAAMAAHACVVVTDDYPTFFLPNMLEAAGRSLRTRLEAVDGNGLMPMRAADGVFARAFDFRRYLQVHLSPHLRAFPSADPWLNSELPRPPEIPAAICERWPMAELSLPHAGVVSRLPIDHGVLPVERRGGQNAARAVASRFVGERLARYDEDRNHPDYEGASGLSPYLHFGHISVHEVVREVLRSEDWAEDRLGKKANGAKEGWWGTSATAESFLDELVTWRERGFNMAWQRPDHDRYESLPPWARTTLELHAADARDHVYSLAAFERAATHDPVWNAAQTQLLREGRMHNYLRMLWGKKILEWTATPRDALTVMLELNNKYALDGRDPNSVSGVFWVLGRYDRAWGPERPIFGKVRYMTSANTVKKLRMKEYLERYA